MKIIELYQTAQNPLFSFEFFPPKTSEGESKLRNTIAELRHQKPGFVSVTYGAGGSTRDKTIDLCADIQSSFGIPSMCHFTCVGGNSSEIHAILTKIREKGIENLIALRGDPPKGQGKFVPVPGGFANATELVHFIKENHFPFCLAAGCYPEKHPDSPTPESDILFLQKKVSEGVDFLVTQLFFSNTVFFRFLEKARTAGISIPIIPGIMPITSFSQIQRFKEMADCEIPDDFVARLEMVKDEPAKFMEESISYTTKQCSELLEKVPGIHFYTLNQSTATIEIMKALK